MKYRVALSLPLILVLLVVGYRAAPPASVDAAGAQNLTVNQECQGGAVTAYFQWQSGYAGEQWIDLSAYDNGFEGGTFLGVGPLSSDTQSFVWDGLAPGMPHYTRINTMDGDGWSSSNTLAFTAIDCSGAAGPSMQGLQASIEQHVAASGLDVAVAVTDLQTGESIHVNGDDPKLTGCTINFLVLLQTVKDLQEGRYPESWVGDLISSTVWSSNPVTARELLLISRDGDLITALEDANSLMQSLGMTSSFLDHPPAYPHETLDRVSNYFTANDVNRALKALWDGQVVSIPWRDYLLDKMVGVKPGLQYLIPAGVGDATVSHKNGFFAFRGGWIDNDAGIVTFNRGGQTYAYAITFLSQDVATKYANVPLGQMVSSLAWQHLSDSYP